ncbi:MAG: hypothetical protein NC238_02905 [Dehalobacter sp.]|nr:hypothetical protein [Dehalobacter sp.]
MSRYSEMINSDSKNSPKLDSIQFSAPQTSDLQDDQRKYGYIDPRVDKAVDHKYWEDLLWNCWHIEKELYYVLHGVRCGGGEITLNRNSFRLLPGEFSAAEWDQLKSVHLDPYRDKLIGILKLSRAMRVTEGVDLPAEWMSEKVNNLPVTETQSEQGVMFDG